MEIAITKMSSKGQVVIPVELRGDIHEGDKLVVFRTGDQIIMKQASQLDKNFEDDLKFAKKTEEAWREYEAGNFKSMSAEEFLEALEKW